MSDIEKQIDELEEKYIEEFDEERMKKEIDDDNFDPRKHQLNSVEAQMILKVIELIQLDIKNIVGKIDDVQAMNKQPFQILADMQRDMSSMRADIDAIKKNQCTPERKAECEKNFEKKKEWRDNWKKYKWGILFSTLAVFTFITSSIFKSIMNWFAKIFGGSP